MPPHSFTTCLTSPPRSVVADSVCLTLGWLHPLEPWVGPDLLRFCRHMMWELCSSP